jgi:hypothetical protein
MPSETVSLALLFLIQNLKNTLIQILTTVLSWPLLSSDYLLIISPLPSFTQLELMRSEELIENWYELQRNLSVQVARDFILEHLKQNVGLNAHSQFSVNA